MTVFKLFELGEFMDHYCILLHIFVLTKGKHAYGGEELVVINIKISCIALAFDCILDWFHHRYDDIYDHHRLPSL